MSAKTSRFDGAGCAKLFVIAILWVAVVGDINIWRHLTGAAVLLDAMLAALLTFAILGWGYWD